MKSSRVASCGLAAILLLTSCSGPATKEAKPSQSSTAKVIASTPTESATSNGSNATAAFSKSELEASVASLRDALGNPLQAVAYEEVEADLENAEAAFEVAEIEPAACKSMVTDNVSLAKSKAIGGAMGMGAADEFGTALLAVVLDGSTEESVSRSFDMNLGRLEACSPLTLTLAETTSTLVTEELLQDLIGEESYALLATEDGTEGHSVYTMTVNARGNGLIASAQSVGTVEPDGILQDHLADIAAQLLESGTP